MQFKVFADMETTLLLLLLGCLLCSCFLLWFVIKFLDKVWRTPIRIRLLMRSQGIGGPPYRFFDGNTKEITSMRKSTASRPMELSSNDMLRRIQPHVHSWINQYGANFLNWYGPKPRLVVSEPALVREILSNKDGAYPKYIIQEFADKLFGNGLTATRGVGWSKKRKIADYAFHGESLKNMIPSMIASVEAMLGRWEEKGGGEIEVFREFTVLTSEIISRTAFGSSYLEGKNTFEMLKKMALIISRNNYRVRIPGTRRFWKARDDMESDQLAQGIRNSIIRMINKREEEVAAAGKQDGYGVDFLGILLKARNEDDPAKRISVDDMVDECKTFYVAGQETTASSLSWTLFLLALHSDWQDRARQEVIRSFGQLNPTPDVIPKLKILNMIVQESLRLYAPVFNITREAEREVGLGHLNLPAGMALALPVLALHTNPEIWGDDVLEFRPDRFANGEVRKAYRDAYIPFGGGPRTCVGMNFAMAEIKIILSMILQRYSFTLSPAYVHSPLHVLIIRPRHGLQIIFQPL